MYMSCTWEDETSLQMDGIKIITYKKQLSTFCHSSTRILSQTCGTDNTNYYCPVDKLCKPRSQRCTHANVCNNPDTNTEDGCYETSISGLYNVQLGHAKLGFSGSKQYSLKH